MTTSPQLDLIKHNWFRLKDFRKTYLIWQISHVKSPLCNDDIIAFAEFFTITVNCWTKKFLCSPYNQKGKLNKTQPLHTFGCLLIEGAFFLGHMLYLFLNTNFQIFSILERGSKNASIVHSSVSHEHWMLTSTISKIFENAFETEIALSR